MQEVDDYNYKIENANNKKWTSIVGIVNLATRNHELDIIEWIRNNVSNTDLFLDIGANVGCLSIHLSDHFEKIIAVEPQRANLFMLKNNVKINDIQNIEVVEGAIWGEEKEIVLQEFSAHDYSGTSRTSEAPTAGCLKSTKIKAITVDSLNVSPSFVKIDIEGAEKECLKGMTETIKRCKPILLIEIHKCYGVDFNDIVNYLKSFDYKETLISQTHDVFFYVFE